MGKNNGSGNGNGKRAVSAGAPSTMESAGQGPLPNDESTPRPYSEVPITIGTSDATIVVGGVGGNTVRGVSYTTYVEDLVRTYRGSYDAALGRLRALYPGSQPSGLDVCVVTSSGLPARVTDEQLTEMNTRARELWAQLTVTLRDQNPREGQRKRSHAEYIPVLPTLLPSTFGESPVLAMRGTASAIKAYLRRSSSGDAPTADSEFNKETLERALSVKLVWWPGVVRIGLGQTVDDFALREFVRTRPLRRSAGHGYTWAPAWSMPSLPGSLASLASSQALQPVATVGDVAMTAMTLSVSGSLTSVSFDARSGANFVKVWMDFISASLGSGTLPTDVRARVQDYPPGLQITAPPMPTFAGQNGSALTRPYVIPARMPAIRRENWGPGKRDDAGAGALKRGRASTSLDEQRAPEPAGDGRGGRDDEAFDDEY